ncbi:30S ribosomal protein S3 [Patescibacteria group bacterium]|nr:30S ribosomal protein S3 [Patescibacteria group bacterium]MCL5797247.1 30S ribosomal protein S3 [Patescibacteria group bacterium]
MGQKVNPKGFRIGPLYSWESRWFANKKDYKNFVVEDAKLRKSLLARLQPAGIVKVEIERSINKINIILNVVRPGMVIGRGGSGMETVKKFIIDTIFAHRRSIKQNIKKASLKVDIRVEPVKEPYLSSYFVASQIAEQLAKRLNHKRAVSMAMEKVKTAGARGVKIVLSGRIGGAEISRRESYKTGTIPLSTLREDVDFAAVPSLTKSGYIGVKVWICKS